jgi:hypothetical protein
LWTSIGDDDGENAEELAPQTPPASPKIAADVDENNDIEVEMAPKALLHSSNGLDLASVACPSVQHEAGELEEW